MELYGEGGEFLRTPSQLDLLKGENEGESEDYLDIRSDDTSYINMTAKVGSFKEMKTDDEYTERNDFTTLISPDAKDDMGSAEDINDILDR